MKLRHAAALVLVGWYLMVPMKTRGGPIDESLPLSQWRIFASFDAAADCQEGLNGSYDDAKRSDQAGKTKGLADLYLAAKCIASDDPRLAK